MEQDKISALVKSQSIIFAALGAGQLITMLAMYMVRSMSPDDVAGSEMILTFQIMVVSMAVGGIGAGIFLYNSKATQTRASQMNIEQKFMQYRTACIIQWALCEGPSLLCAVAYFQTGDATFLVFFGTLLLYYLLKLRPSFENFQRDFNG